MLLYLCLAAIASFRLRPRIAVLAVLVLYCHVTGEYYMWTFLLGALVCQIVSWRISYLQWSNGVPPERPGLRSNAASYIVFGLGLYTLAFPSGWWEQAPFYEIPRLFMPMHWMVPAWFWYGIGAALISITAALNANVQYIFSCKVARFLGRISYALYLVHGIVIRCLGIQLVPLAFAITGKQGVFNQELGFLLAYTIQVPVTLLAAIVFTKMFDDTAITLSKWLERQLE
jgi:peptidoglycan/LPS O-acetylase OafA/YrhL